MPDVLQHCFGSPSTGGPATALARFLEHAGRSYPTMWQPGPAGGLSVGLIRDFMRQIRAQRPRLIHVRGLGNEGFHAALAARLAGVPQVLVSIHGSHRDLQQPRSRLRRAIVAHGLEPATLSLATAIVTVCDYAARRDFLQRHRAKLLPPVPNGVPLPALDRPRRAAVRAELGVGDDRIVAVCVSRLTPEKGYGDLAAALARLDGLDVPLDLVVVGGGDDDGSIRALFAGLRHIGVHFVGHQSDVTPFLEAADLFVFPTWSENLSNALLEAMSYALPVVTTQVGGNTEVIAKGGGILVPSHDPERLAAAIRELIGDPGRMRALGHAARANVERHYSITAMVEGWERTYALLLERRA
ncbi:glycosyl transferase group 1 [Ancylobacter novellus DSM 506]|uniref:Glycosyl transferase group 1 n=1 Tax=Ancylobacter novellus (strain ATCC 8093 / DSM 506 / JCM 20403 / CCM 1077 / IAM 12100 / NBRC 12443 / NCIMB 10456) TaxID=639283 RepID=D7A830_ANCN5|nr:glycosyltransferase [Ancylobacter novellus]ADH90488.1 glycosyl transferase group 1 [Ancylobacter novellus DSM 506]